MIFRCLGAATDAIAERYPEGLISWCVNQWPTNTLPGKGRWERRKFWRDVWSLKKRMHPAQRRVVIEILEEGP